MSETYPLFAGGETLTAADLNQLREFLHDRDRLVARLTGFGLSCGLTGTVTGSGAGAVLTIAPGLACDQRGEPLLLPHARTIALPPTVSSGTFDFIDPAQSGFSVVLEQTEEVTPAPDCGEADCAGHAEEHTRGVALRVVPGRITGPRFDFPTPAMLAVQPLSATATPAAYTALRNTVAGWLDGPPALVDPTVTAAIRATSLASSDVAAVKGYKAGWLDEVLFATLDLLRCQALSAVACQRTATRPGVVLGWLHQVSGVWTWDCTYQHAWEPPPGLSRSLLGGACGQACGLLVAELTGIVTTYAPPTNPPSGGGGVVVDPGDLFFCPDGWLRVGTHCVPYFPPPDVPDHWIDPWVIDPLGPVWNPPWVEVPWKTQPWTPFETDGFDYLDTGVLDVTKVVGGTQESAVDAIHEVLVGLGTQNPSIQVLGPGEALPFGYLPTGGVATHDTVVLTTNAAGVVIGTGRVPMQVSARNVGTDLPVATQRAGEALDATTAQGAVIAGMQGQVGALATDVAGLQDFQAGAAQWRVGVDATLAGLDGTILDSIDKSLGQRFDEYQHRVSTLEGTVGVLTKGGVAGRVALGKDTGTTLVEFARTMTAGLAAMPEVPGELKEALRAAEKATVTLEKSISGDRALGTAAVELLGVLRTAVKAAGIAPALAGQLDAQFDAMAGGFG